MNNVSEITSALDWNAIGIADPEVSTKTGQSNVIFVGRSNYSRLFDAQLSNTNFRLSFAADYRELWAMPPVHSPRLAVLCDTLHSFELEASCRLIRRRWPNARILILRARMDTVDKSLYDARLPANVASQILIAAVRRLAGARLYSIHSARRP